MPEAPAAPIAQAAPTAPEPTAPTPAPEQAAPTGAPAEQAAPAAPEQAAPGTTGTTAEQPAPPPAPGMPDFVGWGILALLAALILAVAFRLVRAKREARAAPELPPKAERIEPPGAAARERVRVEEQAAAGEAAARRKAEYDARKRAEREDRARREAELAALPPEERENRARQLEEEARAARAAEEEERRLLRQEEEARRRAEYQARKEAERAEKERKAREKAEAEAARLRAIEEERARQEQERLAALEAQRKKIEAEAGKTLLEGLTRTREGGFVAKLAGLFGGGKAEVSEQTIGELEEILFTADIGVKTSMKLVEQAQERLKRNELGDPGKLRKTIRGDIEAILAGAQSGAAPALDGLGLPVGEKKPWVIMVVGVNGAGKTTTIGKLAAKLKARGKSVLLAAGDTYRAAATEQLDVWAERAEVPIVKGSEGADPAGLVFEAVQRGVREGFDVVIADTAGRLHTRAPLMEELKKVKRVVGKAREGAPDEVLLVLDATMGQNAIQQARQFHDALGVTGIALTKLDGTAKGGVVIGISDELKIPVRLVGIGESLADLRPFDPKEFVDALFGA